MTVSAPLLSILIPMKNEADGLANLFTRLGAALQAVTAEYEIICVDDGSTDETFARLQTFHEQDSRIKIIRFSRNFGKEAGMAAALQAAKGQAVIPLDADLQDPPELIAEMVALWRQGHKIVLATRRTRDGDTWLKRKTAAGFYWLTHKMSKTPIPADTGDFRLMDRQVVDALNALPERTRFSKGLFSWVGFEAETLYFDREKRDQGTTKFNYWQLWTYALDGLFAFSTIPLRVWTYIGATLAFFSLLYAGFVVIRTLMHGVDVPGYASLIVVVLFMGGVQLISLGVIGEYVGRIYDEVKQRPLYIIRQSIGL